MNEQTVEQAIQEKGLTAPRITLADVEDNIASEHYFTAADCAQAEGSVHVHHDGEPTRGAPLELLTFCVLVLKNGTKIAGINYGPVSPENFDPEYARQDARAQAIEQV